MGFSQTWQLQLLSGPSFGLVGGILAHVLSLLRHVRRGQVETALMALLGVWTPCKLLPTNRPKGIKMWAVSHRLGLAFLALKRGLSCCLVSGVACCFAFSSCASYWGGIRQSQEGCNESGATILAVDTPGIVPMGIPH